MLVWAAFEEHARLETEPRAAAEVGAARESESQHTLVRVLEADPSIPTLIVCMLTGVLVAPIVEEFLFRVLLQGWLEAAERRLRRRNRVFRRVLPGLLPVLIGAVVFALPHYRETDPAAPTPQVGDLILNSGASLLLMLIGLCLVRIRAGATWKDVGFDRTKLWADVRVGLVAALAVLGPIYVIQFFVKSWLLPEEVAADPITLLFFAAVLGTLYLRTHRIAAAVTLHMALNGTSLLAAWFGLAG
jgi:membrane protease YdiL (CAAX protease family)